MLQKLELINIKYVQANTTGSFDPYAEVLCNACRSTKDEHLLLLCDLCDSAAHTYCVGLGFTVPEGDWFCRDCTITRAEHAHSETNNEDNDQDVIMHSALPNVVRRESHRPVNERASSRVSSDSSRVFPSAVPHRRPVAVNEATGPGSRTFNMKAVEKFTESGARTLGRCRNVHSRIRALRENWNALRSGSLSFSPGSSKQQCHSEKHESNAVPHDRSGEVETTSSKVSQQSRNEDSIRSKDIDRAWKMLDLAKSKHCTRGKTSRSSKLPPSKVSGSEERANVSSNHTRNSQQLGYSGTGVGKTGMEKPLEHSSFEKEIKKHQLAELEKERSSRGITKVAAGCSSSLSTTCLPRLLEPSLSKNTISVVDNTHRKNRLIYLEESVNSASSNLAGEQNRPACLVSHGASESFDVKSELSASSLKVDLPNGSTRSKNDSAQSNVVRYDDAKSEIQSLVKLNLKLLSSDKQLGMIIMLELGKY